MLLGQKCRVDPSGGHLTTLQYTNLVWQLKYHCKLAIINLGYDIVQNLGHCTVKLLFFALNHDYNIYQCCGCGSESVSLLTFGSDSGLIKKKPAKGQRKITNFKKFVIFSLSIHKRSRN